MDKLKGPLNHIGFGAELGRCLASSCERPNSGAQHVELDRLSEVRTEASVLERRSHAGTGGHFEGERWSRGAQAGVSVDALATSVRVLHLSSHAATGD